MRTRTGLRPDPTEVSSVSTSTVVGPDGFIDLDAESDKIKLRPKSTRTPRTIFTLFVFVVVLLQITFMTHNGAGRDGKISFFDREGAAITSVFKTNRNIHHHPVGGIPGHFFFTSKYSLNDPRSGELLRRPTTRECDFGPNPSPFI